MRIRGSVIALLCACLACGQDYQPARPGLDPEAYTVTLNGRQITYQVIDGMAVRDGDILMGTAAEVEAIARDPKAPALRGSVSSLSGEAAGKPWTGATVYYTIAPDFISPQRVTDAIAHWQTRTLLRFVERSSEVNYVRFTNATGVCNSFVGMVGGMQAINLGTGCPTGSVIHEIGHAIGLEHEQVRADRNQSVTIFFENIAPRNYYTNYPPNPGAKIWNYYDYGSIMQYGATDFSLTSGILSLDSAPAGIPLGQRDGLSAADVDAVHRMYGSVPTSTTITTIPEGLNVIVDGSSFASPASFDWAPGSSHTLSVEGTQTSFAGRNQFAQWTDGGAQTHTHVASLDQTVVAAEFQQ